MSLIAPLDQSAQCLAGRARVLQVLSRCETVNSIVALLSINFHVLESDVKKEQQLRQKTGGGGTESLLTSSLSQGPSLEFERSDATKKLRLVLSELLSLMAAVSNSSSSPASHKTSELFDHCVYLPELCDVLAIALAELPALLHPTDVCEALLRLKHGPEMICQVVANQSDSFLCVAHHLISLGEKQEEEAGSSNSKRQKSLLMLAKMNPCLRLSMRAICVDMCRMPGTAVLLSLQDNTDGSNSDLVSWISGLLLGTDQTVKNWISFWVRGAAKRKCPALTSLREELSRQLTVILERSGENLNVTCVRESLALLRLLTALRGIAGMKFTEEEVRLVLALITKKPPPSKLGVRLAATGLCILISCPSLLAHPALERSAASWIRWLVGWSEAPREMLLLAAIHFHAGQLSAVADLVCQTLEIKMTVRTNSMTVIKKIFTQEIFTEVVVAQHAVSVPVTENLSSSISGYLPVHCIQQLLKSRVFSKHRVNISPWVYRQLVSTSDPLHPVLPSLIQSFTSSLLLSPNSRANIESHNEPFTETEIRAVFSPPQFRMDTVTGPVSSSGLAAQLCILYYILLFEDIRLTAASGKSPPRHRSYSAQLLNDLPLKYLLGQAERLQGKFEGLYPALLRLASAQFPHLCLVSDWLQAEQVSPHLPLSTRLPSPAELDSALSMAATCPGKLNLHLQQLLRVPPRLAWSLAQTLVTNIRLVLEPGVGRHSQELYRAVWSRLNTVYPRHLWLMTVNSLSQSPRISLEELAIDPLSVLRCDSRVFRTGPILQLLLYMLKASLAASRTRLGKYCTDQQQQNSNIQEAEREELRNSLVLTQESAAIQILLESCLQFPGEDTTSRLTDLQETQSAVCCHLHQAFIEDTSLTLAKLVHFQGYPLDLLPVTTAGVPSMFICLDTSPELLSQPSIDKAVFAVDLISHLGIMCAMPKSLSYARLALNSLLTLLGVLSARERRLLVEPALPAIVRIARAFPPLMEDCIQVSTGLFQRSFYLKVFFPFSCWSRRPPCTGRDLSTSPTSSRGSNSPSVRSSGRPS